MTHWTTFAATMLQVNAALWLNVPADPGRRHRRKAIPAVGSVFGAVMPFMAWFVPMRKPWTSEPIPLLTQVPAGLVYQGAGPLRLFSPQVASAAAVPYVPPVLIEKAKSMQFDPTPDVPEQVPVSVPDPLPPIVPLAVMWKVCPTSPRPAAVDCVGGTSRARDDEIRIAARAGERLADDEGARMGGKTPRDGRGRAPLQVAAMGGRIGRANIEARPGCRRRIAAASVRLHAVERWV